MNSKWVDPPRNGTPNKLNEFNLFAVSYEQYDILNVARARQYVASNPAKPGQPKRKKKDETNRRLKYEMSRSAGFGPALRSPPIGRAVLSCKSKPDPPPKKSRVKAAARKEQNEGRSQAKKKPLARPKGENEHRQNKRPKKQSKPPQTRAPWGEPEKAQAGFGGRRLGRRRGDTENRPSRRRVRSSTNMNILPRGQSPIERA